MRCILTLSNLFIVVYIVSCDVQDTVHVSAFVSWLKSAFVRKPIWIHCWAFLKNLLFCIHLVIVCAVSCVFDLTSIYLAVQLLWIVFLSNHWVLLFFFNLFCRVFFLFLTLDDFIYPSAGICGLRLMSWILALLICGIFIAT